MSRQKTKLNPNLQWSQQVWGWSQATPGLWSSQRPSLWALRAADILKKEQGTRMCPWGRTRVWLQQEGLVSWSRAGPCGCWGF